MDSPYQTINDLIGNSYWGESLLSVLEVFPGINKMLDSKEDHALELMSYPYIELCWPLFLTLAIQVQQTHKTNKKPKDIGPTEQAQSATPTMRAQTHPRYHNV